MKLPLSNTLKLIACCCLISWAGCSPSKPIYLNDTGNLSYYLDQATAVEYPDTDIASLDEVTQAHRPMTVTDPEFTSFEDVTLEDVVSMALLNTKVIRGYGTPGLQQTNVVPGQDSLTNGPAVAATTYNVAIRESEAGFISQAGAISSPSNLLTNTALDSNQGVEAALADFDANYTSSFNVATNDEPRNGTSILNSEVFTQTQVTWQNEFSKKSANGTQMFFRSINQYTENNNPLVGDGGIQVLDSFYRASLEAEIRQPLLRGRGAFIQRMPIVISRINTDQEIANLEATLQNMVTNLEIRYWDLYLAYRNFEAAKTGRDAALETWRIVKDQFDEGTEVNIQNVAQAAEQYHFFDAQVIDAYNSLLNAEGQLRYLLGWSSTDGRFLRPIDEPVMAPVEFDWCNSLCEALTYLPQIRQERWEIKKRELALQYAKNGLLPELNLSFVYRWLGLGNRYGTSGAGEDFPGAGSGALNELYGGNFQELQFGGTFGMPVGFRREEANVRNAQLKLAREIARAEDLELDIARELTEAFRAVSANQMIMRASFNRWINTTEEVEHFERLEDAGVESLDVALDSQRRRSQAEIAFHTAVVEYNKSLALIHRRKGTVLAYSGIEFSEGPWPGKAYVDAGEHARRRTASRQINYGWTRPQVISRGSNVTPNSNTGMTPSAYPIPATQSINVAPSTIYGEPMPMQSPSTETYEMLPNSDGSPMNQAPTGDLPMQPTLANPQGTTTSIQNPIRNVPAQVDQNVQQVVYQQPVTDTTQATVKPAFQPVAVRRNEMNNRVAAARPQRDTLTQPVRRLRAEPQAAIRATPSAATSTKLADAVQPGVTRSQPTSRVQWERLGLSGPEPQGGRTTAKIKMQ